MIKRIPAHELRVGDILPLDANKEWYEDTRYVVTGLLGDKHSVQIKLTLHCVEYPDPVPEDFDPVAETFMDPFTQVRVHIPRWAKLHQSGKTERIADGQRKTMQIGRWASPWARHVIVEAERIDRDTPIIHVSFPDGKAVLSDTDAKDLVDRLQRALSLLPSSK